MLDFGLGVERLARASLSLDHRSRFSRLAILRLGVSLFARPFFDCLASGDRLWAGTVLPQLRRLASEHRLPACGHTAALDHQG
jgi:hypothetical protein